MGNIKDLTGNRYGRLTVLSFHGIERRRRYMWLCKCDCGNETVVDRDKLVRGRTTSCGCYGLEKRRMKSTTHGKSNTRIYHVWNSMRGRCYTKSNSVYSHYGGRGIKVCKEWLVFDNFYNWAVENGWTEESSGISLDMVDVNGDYCPENCRWSDVIQQANNKRNTTMLTARGETKPISEWARDVGINYRTIRSRLNYGWSVEDAIFTPVGRVSKYLNRIVNVEGSHGSDRTD